MRSAYNRIGYQMYLESAHLEIRKTETETEGEQWGRLNVSKNDKSVIWSGLCNIVQRVENLLAIPLKSFFKNDLSCYNVPIFLCIDLAKSLQIYCSRGPIQLSVMSSPDQKDNSLPLVERNRTYTHNRFPGDRMAQSVPEVISALSGAVHF